MAEGFIDNRGATILGGRQYRVTLDHEHAQNLNALAQLEKVSTTEMAERLLSFAVDRTCYEYGCAIAVTKVMLGVFGG